jgi:hypothetical protein
MMETPDVCLVRQRRSAAVHNIYCTAHRMAYAGLPPKRTPHHWNGAHCDHIAAAFPSKPFRTHAPTPLPLRPRAIPPTSRARRRPSARPHPSPLFASSSSVCFLGRIALARHSCAPHTQARSRRPSPTQCCFGLFWCPCRQQYTYTHPWGATAPGCRAAAGSLAPAWHPSASTKFSLPTPAQSAPPRTRFSLLIS